MLGIWAAFFHHYANLFRQFSHLGFGGVHLLLGFASVAVDGQHVFNGFTGSLELFFLQTAYHAFSVLLDKIQC